MKEKLVMELQKKYEYLDFSDIRILNCFEDAYLCIEQDCMRQDSREIGILHMEIEYIFLSKLRGLLQMDKDIYDAVFLRMTPYFDFFQRKRIDLTQFYSKEECETLYQEAFLKTVKEFLQEQSFRRCLIQNLITIFKTKKNNLWTILGTYEKCYYAFLFSILKCEEIELLKKRFGPSFDGIHCVNYLSIYEQKNVTSLLNFMIDYLIILEDTIKNKYISYEELIEKLDSIPREGHIEFMENISVSSKGREVNGKLDCEESKKQTQEIPTLESLSYLDLLIYKGYQFYGDMKQVKEQLLLSDERLLTSILKHFYLYEKEDKVKQYLYEQDAYQIRKIVTFLGEKEKNFFTKKEQDYIYLLACMRQNPILTEQDIFDILSLKKEDVEGYMPMTNHVILNELYVYVKRKLRKEDGIRKDKV